MNSVQEPPREEIRIGELFIEMGLVTRIALRRALDLSRAWGVGVHDVLMSLGYIKPRELAIVLARYLGIDVVRLSTLTLDSGWISLLPEEFMRARMVIPFETIGNRLSLAMADPTDLNTIREIEKTTGFKVVPYVTTKEDIRLTLERFFKGRYLYEATEKLSKESPAESGRRILSRRQALFLSLIVAVSLFWIYLDWVSYLIFWFSFLNLWYLLTMGLKLVLALKGAKHGFEHNITQEEMKSLKDQELPIYTILLPVYKEPEVLPQLFEAIRELDYPKAKLDVKVLFEEDDRETLEMAKSLAPEPFFEFLIVPTSRPKTKPKACNWGLLFARGKYITIYDAEDRPEPDQLKKAILVFRKAHDPRMICVQAALDYYNPTQNILTRWFTLEYDVWFRLFMPGLSSIDTIIPLGGTSNHFVSEKLKELMGWDPFNVTEDADLGVRLAARGYRTTTVNSTTWEEANSVLWGWIKQRSRWVKGYMQTYLVHLRNSMTLIRTVGIKNFLLFQLNIGGVPFVLLANPVTFALLVAWFSFQPHFITVIFPNAIHPFALVNFLVGNFLFVYMSIIALNYSRKYELVLYTLSLPIYWILMSVGAYVALYELLRRPFHWQKTQHGLAIGMNRRTRL